MKVPAKHSSFFSYHLSKPYPFAWFTPVVVIGGIIGTVIFSLINLASSGYELETKFVNNPNDTVEYRPWYMSWSWDQQLQPRCDPQDISVGSQVFTSNLGFTYTLQSASRQNPDHTYTNLGSLSYLNNVLTDCTVDLVHLKLRKVDLSPNGLGRWWSWDYSMANAAAHCVISSPDGPVNVSLSMQYRPQEGSYNHFNHTSHASLWWGSNLLSNYWYSTLLALSEQLYGAPASNFSTTPIWMKGGMTFVPNTTTGDITKDDFFNVPSYHFVAADGSLVNQFTDNVTDLDLLYNRPNYLPYSNSLAQGLSWAKVMYSALLVDLGQATSSPSSKVSQNLLTDPKLLQYILQHPDDTYRNNPRNSANATHDCAQSRQAPCYVSYWDINMIAPPNIVFSTYHYNDSRAARNTSMLTSYDAFKSMMGPLGASNATTIITQYPCQVPKKKPVGTVVLTILVADLVFLQVCWFILKWLAQCLVERRFDNVMFCPGCDGTGVKSKGGQV